MKPPAEIDHLLMLYLANELKQEEMDELEAWLLADPTRVGLLAELGLVDQALIDLSEEESASSILAILAEQESAIEIDRPVDLTDRMVAGRVGSREGHAEVADDGSDRPRVYVIPRAVVWIGLAAMIGVAVYVVSILYSPSAPTRTEHIDGEIAVEDKSAVESLRAQYATVIGRRGVVWGREDQNPALGIGGEVGSSQYHLLEGLVRLRTREGAEVLIEAPARFAFTDSKLLTLDQGRLVGVVETPEASGFTVRLPGMDVVDLGTEFTASYLKDEGAFAQVVRGEVEVRQTSGPAEARTSILLQPKQAVAIGSGGRSLIRAEYEPGRFVRSLEPSELEIGRDYIDQVHASEPSHYWRFDSLVGLEAPNHVDGGTPLRIQGDQHGVDLSTCPQNRYMQMRAVREHILVTNEVIEFDSSRYTVECWIKPMGRELETLYAMQGIVRRESYSGYGIHQVELMPKVDEDGNRIPGYGLHITHSTQPGWVPTDLDTGAVLELERWHHLVVARDGMRLRVYLDGERIADVQCDAPGQKAEALLVVGRNGTTPGGKSSLFNGGIDEFAIYSRELSAAEVKAHYLSTRPDIQDANLLQGPPE